MARSLSIWLWVVVGCCVLACAVNRGVRAAPIEHVDEHAEMIKQMNGMIGKMESTLENVRAAFKAKEAELQSATGLRKKEMERLGKEKKELQATYENTAKQVEHLQEAVAGLEKQWRSTASDLQKEKQETKKERQAREKVARELAKSQAEFQALHDRFAQSSVTTIWLTTAEDMADEIGTFLGSPRIADFLKMSAAKITSLTLEMNDLVQTKMGAKQYGLVVRSLLALVTFSVPIYVGFYLISRAGKIFGAHEQVLIAFVLFLVTCMTLFFAALVLRADPLAVLLVNRDDKGFSVTLILLSCAVGVLVTLALLVRVLINVETVEERAACVIQMIALMTLAATWRSLFWNPLMKPMLSYKAPHPVFYAGFAAVFVSMTVLSLKMKELRRVTARSE
ncbi:hypothetical protein FVE85_3930 [Porphyridium purpureum]|uniref:Transmembrane protein n=1 Tax=Porphyridium purpureum TaxID=35688 RepID=A0A5J4YRQ1_PORPP|nr:hypothetical protein FVE85_3930 [Porphyridium purpureum]|eukprot:POR3281..scf229_5